MEIVIKLKNTTDINIIIPLLQRLGITFTEKKSAVVPDSFPITFAQKPDFMSLEGIWKNKNITQEQLRKDAWDTRL